MDLALRNGQLDRKDDDRPLELGHSFSQSHFIKCSVAQVWESKSLNISVRLFKEYRQIHQGSLTYSCHPDLACASRGSLFGLDEGIVEYVHKLVPTEWAVTTHRLDGWSWCKQPVQDSGMGWQHVVSESGVYRVYRVYPSSLHFNHRQTDDTPQ